MSIAFELSEVLKTHSAAFFRKRGVIGFGAVEPRPNGVFAAVTEWRVANVVRQASRLDNIAEYICRYVGILQAFRDFGANDCTKRPPHRRDFDAMRQARMHVVVR